MLPNMVGFDHWPNHWPRPQFGATRKSGNLRKRTGAGTVVALLEVVGTWGEGAACWRFKAALDFNRKNVGLNQRTWWKDLDTTRKKRKKNSTTKQLHIIDSVMFCVIL